MDYKDKINSQLEIIEECGRCMFSLKETAIVIEVSLFEFKQEYKTNESEAFKAYNRGFLQTKMKIHKALLNLAENGSSPAQAQIQLIYNKLSIANE